MAEIKITRRFFTTLAAFLVPSAFLIKYLTPGKIEREGIRVPIADLPQNGVYLIRDRRIGIIRTPNDISVLSIACTHLGCTLNVVSDEFICPCHGSIFTLKGEVTKGPALTNLRPLQHTIENETMIIYV